MISRRAKITRTGAATDWFQGEDWHARRRVSFSVVANDSADLDATSTGAVLVAAVSPRTPASLTRPRYELTPSLLNTAARSWWT